MLKKIENLPANVVGLRAEGEITKEDYEKTLIPLLEKEHRRGGRVRFLYQFAPDFTGFTTGAMMDDFQIGMKYLRLFEKCAVVTDTEWIQKSVQLFSSLTPFPVQVFKNEKLTNAIDWLSQSIIESNLKFELQDDGVLIVHPKGPLRREDFDQLSSLIDPWIETHHHLNGMVVSIDQFPGWENVGSFIHHFEFINAHHRQIRRVALAVTGVLPEIVSKVASHFVEAEVKQFPYDKTKDAIAWVKG